jgi:hypothetical protein
MKQLGRERSASGQQKTPPPQKGTRRRCPAVPPRFNAPCKMQHPKWNERQAPSHFASCVSQPTLRSASVEQRSVLVTEDNSGRGYLGRKTLRCECTVGFFNRLAFCTRHFAFGSPAGSGVIFASRFPPGFHRPRLAEGKAAQLLVPVIAVWREYTRGESERQGDFRPRQEGGASSWKGRRGGRRPPHQTELAPLASSDPLVPLVRSPW